MLWLCTLTRLAGGVALPRAEGTEMRNPHAGEPFTTSDDEIADGAARREHPDADAVARAHVAATPS